MLTIRPASVFRKDSRLATKPAKTTVGTSPSGFGPGHNAARLTQPGPQLKPAIHFGAGATRRSWTTRAAPLSTPPPSLTTGEDLAQQACAALQRDDSDQALHLAAAALAPEVPGGMGAFTKDVRKQLIQLSIGHADWPLLKQVLTQHELESDDLMKWAAAAVHHHAPASVLDHLLSCLRFSRYDARVSYGGGETQFKLVALYKAHASPSTLARMRETHGLVPAVAASWAAGRIDARDVRVLLDARALAYDSDLLPSASSLVRTLEGHEATMMPAWRAMMDAHRQDNVSGLEFYYLVRDWDATGDPVRSAADFRQKARDPGRYTGLVDEALRGMRSRQLQRVLVRHAVSQWLTHDLSGLRASLHALDREDYTLSWSLKGRDEVMTGIGQWALQQRDWTSLAKLFGALPKPVAVSTLHELARLDAPPMDAGPLFQSNDISISRLPHAVQAWVVRNGMSAEAVPWFAPWDIDQNLAQAFARIGNADPRDQPRLLAAWRACVRVPSFARLFRAIDLHSDAAKGLVDDPTLTDRSLLLGLAVLATGVPGLLQQPRVQQLLRDKHVVKNDARLRSALDALDTISDIGADAHGAVDQLFAWPTPAHLRTQLMADVQTRLAASTQRLHEALDAPTLRPDLHRSQDVLARAINLATLHASHVHQAGDAEEVRQHRDALTTLIDAVAHASTALAERIAPYDAEASEQLRQLAQRTNNLPGLVAAKQTWTQARRHSHADAVHAELVTHAAVLVAALEQLTRQQQALDKPTQPRDVPDFFTLPHHNAVLRELQHRVSAERIDGLSMLGHLHALGAPLTGGTPQALQAQLKAALPLDAAQQGAVDALQQSFRQPRLLWALAKRSRDADTEHADAFRQLFADRLEGEKAYRARRAGAPQMQHLFAGGARASLQQAWEAGAQMPCHNDPKLAGLTAVDTGDFTDFASSGDEIGGSCHSLISGNMGQRLLARMVDGSRRMLALKDNTGTLRARAMFRLMHDATTGAPVLLLSTLYTDGINQEAARRALVALARSRAQALGLPLLAMTDRIKSAALGTTASHDYPHDVESLSGPLSEYWDEPITAERNGVQRLSGLQVL